MPTTPEEAVYARLAADETLTGLVAGRVTPSSNTQDDDLPCVVYQRVGKDSAEKLDGSRALAKYSIRVDVYGGTEAETQAVGNAVHDSLSGWRDSGEGVQGVFPGDASTDETEDGYRVWSETFGVWFAPTA